MSILRLFFYKVYRILSLFTNSIALLSMLGGNYRKLFSNTSLSQSESESERSRASLPLMGENWLRLSGLAPSRGPGAGQATCFGGDLTKP